MLNMLHANRGQREKTLEEDVVAMGERDGRIVHVLQTEQQAINGPPASETPVVHILAHGRARKGK